LFSNDHENIFNHIVYRSGYSARRLVVRALITSKCSRLEQPLCKKSREICIILQFKA
jgi:hypothetical protein